MHPRILFSSVVVPEHAIFNEFNRNVWKFQNIISTIFYGSMEKSFDIGLGFC